MENNEFKCYKVSFSRKSDGNAETVGVMSCLGKEHAVEVAKRNIEEGKHVDISDYSLDECVETTAI